jgi:molybdate transport system permease protein
MARSAASWRTTSASYSPFAGPEPRSPPALWDCRWRFARLESAAATLGASTGWVFATVTLPLIVPGILNGLLLAFARSLGEFGATITFVSSIPGETQTLPLAIYTLTQIPGGDAQAWRLCALSIILSLGALMVSEWLLRAARRRVLA